MKISRWITARPPRTTASMKFPPGQLSPESYLLDNYPRKIPPWTTLTPGQLSPMKFLQSKCP